MLKVIFLGLGRESGRVRNRGEEYGLRGVVGDHLLWVSRLQGAVPAIEEGSNLLFGRRMTAFRPRFYVCGHRRKSDTQAHRNDVFHFFSAALVRQFRIKIRQTTALAGTGPMRLRRPPNLRQTIVTFAS